MQPGLVAIDIDAARTQPSTRDWILPGIPIGDHVDLTGVANGFHTFSFWLPHAAGAALWSPTPRCEHLEREEDDTSADQAREARGTAAVASLHRRLLVTSQPQQ